MQYYVRWSEKAMLRKKKDKRYENRKARSWRVGSESDMGTQRALFYQ